MHGECHVRYLDIRQLTAAPLSRVFISALLQRKIYRPYLLYHLLPIEFAKIQKYIQNQRVS